MNCSLPGSSVLEISQARILEWVAISSSRYLFNPGIEPTSLAYPVWQTDSLPLSHLGGPFSCISHYLCDMLSWAKSLSRVRLFATPWTAAYQAPPSMGFFRQEYWSGVPLPSLTSMLGKYKQAFESNRKRYWNFLCLPATDWGYQEIQIRPSSCDQWNWQRRGYKNKESMPSTWYNAS